MTDKTQRKNRFYYYTLFAFYFTSFLTFGISTFSAKYFGEIGLSNFQIGILTSVPGLIGILAQPVWGVFSDRAKYKKTALIIATLGGGVAYLCLGFTKEFMILMIGLTAAAAFHNPVMSISGSIALEHTENNGGSFGHIRLGGTVGYIAGALFLGIILNSSLNGMYLIFGAVVLVSCVFAMLLPPVEGHQHGREKVSYTAVLKDKKILLVLIICFFGSTTNMFYISFFTKRLGDLGIDNGVTGIITVISVLLEIPFLMFSGRLYKKFSIWQWLAAGLLLNSFRWLVLGFADNVPMIIIANIPTVSVLASFEFFPSVYLNEHTIPELKGSAQNMLFLFSGGLTKITGGFLEGYLCDHIGIPATFLLNGIMLAVIFVLFLIPCIRFTEEEKNNA